ncbi:hypothetical protein G7046_g3645 [Stylonectria norvegica]|nr:hypothetical protein G7046_g3645 [Stylonectria norvegica]
MPHSNLDGPLVKRQKTAPLASQNKNPANSSRIFAPFRTVGLVSPTNVPFTSIPMGKTTFQISTSVGRSLQTYDLKRGLNLLFITRPQTPADITATFAWKEKIFAAWGGKNKTEAQGVWVFQRGKKVDELELPADLAQPITQILVFGTWTIACASTRIDVFKTATLEHYTTIHTMAASNGGNEISGGIVTMPTFLNKIFVGRKDGWVEIWNVSTGKLIYTILPPASDCGAVTCLEPSPALSLLAIAYSEGPLVITNVLTDKPVLQVEAGSSSAPVNSISFRTDGVGAGSNGRKDGVMATTTRSSGDVTFWDLNGGGRVMGVLRSAHNPPSHDGPTARGGISKVEFLTGQPVIVTSGLDNSLKSWIFDETPFSPVPRILHQRSGHAGPVNCLQFLPSDFDGAEAGNKWLLSGGKDRSLWGWSLRRDGQSTELSQGNIRKKAKKVGILATNALAHGPTTTLEDLKAPEITCLASSLNRDGGIGAMPGNQPIWQKSNKKKTTNAEVSGSTGWESVVTAHKDDPYARTWFWGRKRAGRWAFPTGDGSNVSTVTISPCGTFALVGSELGGIDMYNLQSGVHRQRFPSKLTPAQARQVKMQQLRQADDVVQMHNETGSKFPAGTGKHTKAITGLVIDSMNKTVVSCSLDGKIKFWDFLTGTLIEQIDWAPMTLPTGCRYHPASELLAVSCDDLSIRVVDMETKRTIREFWGPQDTINDFCFSNDGRWIIAASQDCLIRIWDLPTSHLIDAIRLEKPCKAVAMSLTGDYLAATIQDELGVTLWTNKSLFKHVPTQQISEKEIGQISAPTTSGEGSQGILEGAFEEDHGDEEDTIVAPTIEQLSSDMTTLSLVPKSRWQTLLHLDLIKERNKPTEAPKAPEKAPFFLPSTTGGNNITQQKAGAGDDDSSSRITRLEKARFEEVLSSKLRSGAETGNYDEFIDHLKSLSPSSADLELRSLSVGDGGDGSNELLHFIRALTTRLRARRDYELTQAWMTVFLRLHFDLVMENEALLAALGTWKSYQEKECARLDGLPASHRESFRHLDLLGSPAGSLCIAHIARGLDGRDELEGDISDTNNADDSTGDLAEDMGTKEETSDEDVDWGTLGRQVNCAGWERNLQTPRPTKEKRNEAYRETWGGIWNSATCQRDATSSLDIAKLTEKGNCETKDDHRESKDLGNTAKHDDYGDDQVDDAAAARAMISDDAPIPIDTSTGESAAQLTRCRRAPWRRLVVEDGRDERGQVGRGAWASSLFDGGRWIPRQRFGRASDDGDGFTWLDSTMEMVEEKARWPSAERHRLPRLEGAVAVTRAAFLSTWSELWMTHICDAFLKAWSFFELHMIVLALLRRGQAVRSSAGRVATWSQWQCRSLELTSSVLSLRRAFHGQTQGHRDAGIGNIRNIGIIAHVDAGKTTTTERMLYYSGVTQRVGDVDSGNTVTDFLDLERERGITIQSAAITFHWPLPENLAPGASQNTINLIDTPGHQDFRFEVDRCLPILDGAVCIIDSVKGVEAHTERVWGSAHEFKVPRIVYCNKLDREGASFKKAVLEIGTRLKGWPLVCQIPWWEKEDFVGVIDVVDRVGYRWKSEREKVRYEFPELKEKLSRSNQQLLPEIELARKHLVEGLADFDDAIMEEFLEENQNISGSIIKQAIRRAIQSGDGRVIPVFAGSSFRHIGVEPLMDAIADYLPSPEERPDVEVRVSGVKQKLKTILKHDKDKKSGKSHIASIASVFKVFNHPKEGVISFVRVYHGTLAKNASSFNTNMLINERPMGILQISANKADDIQELSVGQIGALRGLKKSRTGDTLITTTGGKPVPEALRHVQIRPPEIPPPVAFLQVEPYGNVAAQQLEVALENTSREDPSLRWSKDPKTEQFTIQGMGKLHLDVSLHGIRQRYKIDAEFGPIEVDYKECVTVPTQPQHVVFDRPVASKSGKASCTVVLEPLEAHHRESLLESSIERDGNIYHIAIPLPKDANSLSFDPDEARQQLLNGAIAGLARGPRRASPIHGCNVTITLDTTPGGCESPTGGHFSTVARTAVQAALRDSFEKEQIGIVEPIMLAHITCPEVVAGAVQHDITAGAGGHILEVNDRSAESLGDELIDVSRIYTPPDPYDSVTSLRGKKSTTRMVEIVAKVPYKEMLDYDNHLRSKTAGRHSMTMSFDSMSDTTKKCSVVETTLACHCVLTEYTHNCAAKDMVNCVPVKEKQFLNDVCSRCDIEMKRQQVSPEFAEYETRWALLMQKYS